MTRIYVGSISSEGKMEELRSLFEDCGIIKSFDIKEGSGYIEYATQEEAEEAIKKCHGKTFADKALVVESSRRPIRSRKLPPSRHSFNNGSSHYKYSSRYHKSRSISSHSSHSRRRHHSSKRKHSHNSPKKSKHSRHRHHSRNSRSRSRSRSRSHS